MRRSSPSQPTRRADVPTGQGQHQAQAKSKSEEIRTERDPDVHLDSGAEVTAVPDHLREPSSLVDQPRVQQPEPSIEPSAPPEAVRQAEAATGSSGYSDQGNVASDVPVEAGPAKASSGVPISRNRCAPRPRTNGFRKAVKFGAKARVAFIGVSGGGKSYTMLTLARALAGPSGKIACIDTEHGSLSKYADLFDFDTDEPSSYTIDYLIEQLTYAELNGYAVFCVDSWSHFWMGKDGALEFVDSAKKRTRDPHEAWRQFNPHERLMVDRFIASPCHILVTMRTKTDYEEQIGGDGKKRRVKVGLAPVQRDGLEYEFDLVCSMDDENNLLVDKTRCSAYTQEKLRLAARPDAQYFEPFIQWLAGTEPPPVAKPLNKPWSTFGEMVQEFAKLQTALPADVYIRNLAAYGVGRANQFRSATMAWACYQKLQSHLADRTTFDMPAGAMNPASYEHFLALEGEAI